MLRFFFNVIQKIIISSKEMVYIANITGGSWSLVQRNQVAFLMPASPSSRKNRFAKRTMMMCGGRFRSCTIYQSTQMCTPQEWQGFVDRRNGKALLIGLQIIGTLRWIANQLRGNSHTGFGVHKIARCWKSNFDLMFTKY
ncbi:Uncharacterized protein Adt_43970 [Abeliophyllum distichum]|uniref:Uncharacterized protein n=1 Tax=Abeliophyllum distichum TaxID=126358 RepID=A0ABD1P9I6_9LAMI